MRPTRPIAIRVLVAVACGIASVVLGSTVAAADDGPAPKRLPAGRLRLRVSSKGAPERKDFQMAGRSPKNQKGGGPPKHKKNTTSRSGGAGPLVRDRKEAVQKGVSPARRTRGDHPR